MRAFLALDVKDEITIKKIVEIQELIQQTGAKVKLVEPKNFHFTVRFFGEINEIQAEKVISLLSDLKIQPLNVIYQGMGAFPNLNRLNVIWFGINQSVQES